MSQNTCFDITTRPLLAQFAQHVVLQLMPGAVLYLHGDLGVGKTSLVQAMMRLWDASVTVRSPSFPILEVYELPQHHVLHMDLYRIQQPEELHMLGLRDYLQLQPAAIWLIEWPQRGQGEIPAASLHLNLSWNAANGQRGVVVSQVLDKCESNRCQ